ncbi:lysostaphin resistance A-like protein [Patescibacteria group bacterium]
MKNKSLIIYFIILFLVSLGLIVGMKILGQGGNYLAQAYMMTPAIAALITRLFFYDKRFKDANLRFGKLKHYFKFWGIAAAITLFSFLIFTLLGSIDWDLSGASFLERLSEQFALSGQDIMSGLPPGFTPQIMLWLFFIGGLTLFNIVPGIISGFGEEFGHRGFMFPALYKIKPWFAFIGGGLIWYAWHWPLMLVMPQASAIPFYQTVGNMIFLAIGSICTFTFLAYVYVKSRSIWVTSIAHITMNNAAASFSYFVIIKNQFLANFGLMLTMILVVVILYYLGEFRIFNNYFTKESNPTRV